MDILSIQTLLDFILSTYGTSTFVETMVSEPSGAVTGTLRSFDGPCNGAHVAFVATARGYVGLDGHAVQTAR